MRNILFLLIFIPSLLFAFSGSGSGTPGDPYLIYSIDQLQEMNDDLRADYRLMKDLDASETSTWNDNAGFKPIGSSSAMFKGSLHGGGHVITNLYINRNSENNLGLIGFADSAKIDSLGITGSVIGGSNLGGIIGSVNSYVDISNCYSSVNISATGRAGGILGSAFTNVTLLNCYSTGHVSAGNSVGGLVGLIQVSVVENCYSTGTVAGTANVGGLIGSGSGISTLNSYWDMDASGVDSSNGGIGKKTWEMEDIATFSTWDIPAVWNVMGDYPVLAWQEDAPGNIVNGDGSAGNPFQITNVYQLKAIDNDVTASYRVMNDIEASITEYWNGGEGFGHLTSEKSNEFTGSLHGGGFVVSNLIINDPTGAANALIGFAASGTIIDSLHLESVNISGDYLTAGLIAYARRGCIIRNSSVKGTITGEVETGLLVGRLEGTTVTNCFAEGTVTGTGRVGGLIGVSMDSSVVSQSHSAANVNGSRRVGGLLGESSGYSDISSCFTSGTITATDSLVGGFIGEMKKTIIDSSYASGSVNGGSKFGGFAGLVDDTSNISQCYSTGNCSGTFTGGGFAGFIYRGSEVKDCYVTSAQVSGSGASIGGFAGSITSARISNTYSVVNALIGADNIGGVSGSNSSAEIWESHWDTTVCNVKATTGAGILSSTEEMMTENNYMDFSFPDVWCMDNGTEYPLLRWTAVTLKYEAEAGGDIVGDTLQYVFKGKNSDSVTTNTAEGYHLDQWSDNSDSEYHFVKSLTANDTIAALFKTHFTDGDGSIGNPFQITNLEQLQAIRDGLNSHYRIMNDINASGSYTMNMTAPQTYSGFEPVGTNGSAFTGSLNGAGFTIDSLFMNRSGNKNALFGTVEGGVTLDSINMTNVNIKGDGDDIAGLVGYADSAYISNCSVTGEVHGGYYTGALVGELLNGMVDRCWAEASVKVDEDYVGGLVGYLDTDAEITRSYSKGNVTGYTAVGGLVGDLDGGVRLSYSKATVKGNNENGGLIGSMNNGALVENCFVQSDTVLGTGREIGGLVGRMGAGASAISKSYAVVKTLSGSSKVGGVLGEKIGGTISEAYWDSTASSEKTSAAGGSPLTTSEIQTSSNLSGFTFQYPWCMDDGTEYPMLRWTAMEVAYTSDGNGTISGDAIQYVFKGDEASMVEAVPATNYEFIKWSDGVTDNPRIDINITSDISVIAEFDLAVEITEEDVDPVDNMEELVFAPNPVPADVDEVFFVTPSKLSGEWEVVIFDNDGDIIDRQTFRSNGGYTYRWDLRNKNGTKVASGAYVAVIRCETADGTVELFRRTIGVKR